MVEGGAGGRVEKKSVVFELGLVFLEGTLVLATVVLELLVVPFYVDPSPSVHSRYTVHLVNQL